MIKRVFYETKSPLMVVLHGLQVIENKLDWFYLFYKYNVILSLNLI
jgi:hypothetical protein